MRQASNPTQKWLVTPVTFMLLLHQWAQLALQVIAVACEVLCWVLWKLVSREDAAFTSVLAGLLYVL